MSPGRQILFGVVTLTVLTAIGTLGYVLIEGVNPFDAFYQVVITISTVGFQEEFALSRMGQLWTVLLVITGIGAALFTAAASIEYLLNLRQELRKTRMKQEIDRLRDHIVLCGFGRVGRGVWTLLNDADVASVVLDSDPARAEAARQAGALVVEGDATHNDVLMAGGVENAETVIACVEDDSDNLVIALSVKSIRPDLRVICRATELESERKLRLAGADAVVAPQAVGAERMAMMALKPELAQIFDVVISGRPVEFRVEELDIDPNCVVVGKSIKDSGVRQTSGALILAIEGAADSVVVNPGPDLVLKAGERLVVVGTQQQVERAAELLKPSAT